MALPDWLERQIREAQERARAPPMPTVTIAETTKGIIASLIDPQISNERRNAEFYRMIAGKLREVLMDSDAYRLNEMARTAELNWVDLAELLEKLKR